MRTTQRQNVLRYLLHGPLCGVHDDWKLGRRIAARIHELRETGFNIETTPCDLGHNHRNAQIKYSLGTEWDWADWCAYCGPLTPLRFAGDYRADGTLFEVACGRCGEKDYR